MEKEKKMRLYENQNGTVVTFYEDTEMLWMESCGAYIHMDDNKDFYTEEDDIDLWTELDHTKMESFVKWCKSEGLDPKYNTAKKIDEFSAKIDW
jgi:hypothetical protein